MDAVIHTELVIVWTLDLQWFTSEQWFSSLAYIWITWKMLGTYNVQVTPQIKWSKYLEFVQTSEYFNIPDVKIKKCCFREMHTEYRRLLPGQGQPSYYIPKNNAEWHFKKCIKRVSKFDSLGVNQTLEINNMWSNIKLFDIEYQMLELWGFSIGHIHCCGRLVSELRELNVGIFCLRYRESW